MKTIINFLFLCLFLSIQASIVIADLKKDLVSNFDSDKDVQDSVDYSICVKALENQEFLDEVQKLIDEGEYPEGSNLLDTAFAICQNAVKNEEIQTTAQPLINKAKTGTIKLLKPVKLQINDMALAPLEREVILQRLKFLDKLKNVLEALKHVVEALIELVDAIADCF